MAAGTSFNLSKGNVVTDDVLPCLSGCGSERVWRGTLGCCRGSSLALHGCTLPGQAYTPAGSREDPGGLTKAGGSRSGVRDPMQTPAQQCCCHCSQGQAAAELASAAQVCVQNREPEVVDLRGKGRRSRQCCREYF